MRRPATKALPSSRLLRLVAATAAGAAVLAGLGIGFVQLPLTPTATASGTSSISLLDDDGGSALFSAARLSPGRVDTACVGLTARGSVDPDTEVGLSADVRTGALAPYLAVSVERGSVPAGGGCAAFTGEEIWTGTLAEVPGADAQGIATGWRPALAQRSVYRFTVGLLDDPRAQGLQASVTFRWSLTEALPEPTTEPLPQQPQQPQPLPEPSPTPDPVPATAPSRAAVPPVTPTSTPAPTPTATEAPTPTTDAAPVAPPETPSASAPAAPTPVPDPAVAGGSSDVVEAPPLEAGPAAAIAAVAEAVAQVVAQVASQVGQTAVAIANDGQFPVVLVAVVAAFLFLQGRLDRRDPKLALARVREELSEYRDFPEPPTTETT